MSYFTTEESTFAVVSAAGVAVESAAFTSVEALPPHDAILTAIINAIAPTFALLRIVVKRLALYNARVVKKSLFCSD